MCGRGALTLRLVKDKNFIFLRRRRFLAGEELFKSLSRSRRRRRRRSNRAMISIVERCNTQPELNFNKSEN